MANNLKFQDLLTWEDVLSLGDPSNNGYLHMSSTFFELCCTKKYYANIFDENLDKFVIKPFLEEFPDFPGSVKNFIFAAQISEKDGKPCFKISKPYFCAWLLQQFSYREMNVDKMTDLIRAFINNNDLKELITNLLKDNKMTCSKHITEYGEGKKVLEFSKSTFFSRQVTKEELVEKRRSLNWCIKNIDRLFEYIDNTVIDNSLFDSINKDNFLLSIAGRSFSASDIFDIIEGEHTKEECLDFLKSDVDINYLTYINNYLLMVKYLEEENGNTYDTSINCNLDEHGKFILSTKAIRQLYDALIEIIGDYQEFKDIPNYYHSYEELLSNKVTKAWKKIQNEKTAAKIRLNWEMIPVGEKITLNNYSKGSVKTIRTNKDNQSKLKKAYDLVEEKMDYFSSTKPLFELTGINTFEGYSAYMYENGVVVFEKFFKKDTKSKGTNRTDMLVPVDGEAIYVMNFREFADLSKYTKMELIQEIKDYNNPDVKRIYHSSKWRENVSKVINGPGYGTIELEDISDLSKELSSGSKVKKLGEKE